MDGLGRALLCLFVFAVVFGPLGIWKAVELVAWLTTHVSVSVQ